MCYTFPCHNGEDVCPCQESRTLPRCSIRPSFRRLSHHQVLNPVPKQTRYGTAPTLRWENWGFDRALLSVFAISRLWSVGGTSAPAPCPDRRGGFRACLQGAELGVLRVEPAWPWASSADRGCDAG